MRFETRYPDRPEAKGALRSKGSRSRPAAVGVLSFTDWKRCGILTTIDVKGKPVKNAFLFILSALQLLFTL